MELPLVNESSFTPANAASYSLEDFLPLGNGIRDHTRVLRLTMGNSEQTMGVVMDSAGNREEESTVTEQSMIRDIAGGGRKKRMSNDSSKIASICDAEQLMNSSLKRVKLLELKEENKSLKNEEDGTSATGGKHAEQNIIVPEPPKQDYIHVRARRGQATDSHSLAERARRERISERMKFLQDLVPGCNKQVVGKALVLDEIINYVQSLQHQVEFLSMKLEAVNASIIPKDKMLPAKDDLTMWG